MGATAVLDTAAEIPPAKKSLAKDIGSAKAGIICVSVLFEAIVFYFIFKLGVDC